jgi:hypothetical protein
MKLALEHLKPMGKDADSQEAFRADRKRLTAKQKELETRVSRRQRDLASRAELKGLARARAAFGDPYRFVDAENKPQVDPRGMGLILDALDQLDLYLKQPSKGQAVERLDAYFMQALLVMKLGDFRKVHDALPELRQNLGPRFPFVHARYAAAVGDYATLEQALAALDKDLDLPSIYTKAREPLARLVGLFFLDDQPGPARFAHQVANAGSYGSFIMMCDELENICMQKSELRMLRGLCALEQGDTAKARTFLRESLTFSGPRTLFADEEISRRYLELLDGP